MHTILIIEDNRDTRHVLDRVLSLSGYSVRTAERALQGLDMARSEVPDLILTDVNLPDMSGFELATTLRSDPRFTRTPIVAVSVEDDIERQELSLAAGIDGFLSKTIDPDELTRQIALFLKGARQQVDTDRLEKARTRYTQDVVNRLEQRIRELEDKNAALRRLDQMKDTFIQLTAHELRTPLALLNGYNRLLADDPTLQALADDDSDLMDLFGGLEEAIDRMHRIIEEILTISRIMTNEIQLNPQTIDLGRVARYVLESYRDAFIQRRMTVHFDMGQWPREFNCDADLIRLVIDNLVSNAIKHTPDGGRIRVMAAMRRSYLRFSVADSGIGIAADDQTRIFERMNYQGNIQHHSTSRTAFRGGGLGLGLAISKGIIEAHGGKIWAESPGHNPKTMPGSEFHVVLPLRRPENGPRIDSLRARARS